MDNHASDDQDSVGIQKIGRYSEKITKPIVIKEPAPSHRKYRITYLSRTSGFGLIRSQSHHSMSVSAKGVHKKSCTATTALNCQGSVYTPKDSINSTNLGTTNDPTKPRNRANSEAMTLRQKKNRREGGSEEGNDMKRRFALRKTDRIIS